MIAAGKSAISTQTSSSLGDILSRCQTDWFKYGTSSLSSSSAGRGAGTRHTTLKSLKVVMLIEEDGRKQVRIYEAQLSRNQNRRLIIDQDLLRHPAD